MPSSNLLSSVARRLQSASLAPVTRCSARSLPRSIAASHRIPHSSRTLLPSAASRVFSRSASSSPTTTMDAAALKNFLADNPPAVVRLEIGNHFDALSEKHARYAHYISKASFAGFRIVLRQCSPESEHIFDFIIALHNTANGDWKSLAAKAGVDESEVTYFLEYAAQFFGNEGNYKGFGDVKFIPRASEKSVAALATTSPEATKAYEATNGGIFATGTEGQMYLGFTDQDHVTTYYPDSPDIKKDEIDAISGWMEKKGLLPENTRLRKNKDGSFDLLIASADTSAPADGSDVGKETSFVLEDGVVKGKTLNIVFGDHSKEMAAISAYIEKAAENSDSQNQKEMHEFYTKSFKTGSMESFKDSQRRWIRDKGPMVESNIGFIETYRDPAGIRGEWEGFAAMVNLERTRAFGALVDASPGLVSLLPWAKEFEKDKFLSPDFTSLEVLTFSGSGIPAGINIPNFDDIRQTEGFKNVSLGNVMSAKAPNEKVPFIRDEDLELYQKHRDVAFEVQVGLHELTGHGCGKLLQETSPGVFNFDKENPPVSPITNKPVTTWYKPGQTWSSVFGSIASSYEECRAELVAMHLSCEFPVLKIFGYGDGSEDINGVAGDILYVSYLTMARAGLASIETWDPKSQKWGQAHSQARFSILKCFLEAGDDFCKLDYTKDDLSDLTIKLDRSKILTTGRKAVADYLQKIHIYKATGDVEEGTKFYNHMTDVGLEFWGTKVRDIVLANKQPRKVFIQANTTLDEATGKVSLTHYDATLEGMIQSWADRKL